MIPLVLDVAFSHNYDEKLPIFVVLLHKQKIKYANVVVNMPIF